MIRISGFSKKFIGTVASQFFLPILFFSALLSLAACSGSGEVAKNKSIFSKSNTTSETEYLEDKYWARVDSAKMQFTQADVDFMTGMITHHAQALIMSDLAPKNDASPAIQTLTSRIINAQKDEIQSMQQWLDDRNQSVPEVHINGLILTITMKTPSENSSGHQQMQHSHSGTAHAGMLTQQQLNELAELNGVAFDRTFLKYMIDHHQGAVTMVKSLFDTDGAALDHQVFRLASDIHADQKTEIERMKLMLRNLKDS